MITEKKKEEDLGHERDRGRINIFVSLSLPLDLSLFRTFFLSLTHLHSLENKKTTRVAHASIVGGRES